MFLCLSIDNSITQKPCKQFKNDIKQTLLIEVTIYSHYYRGNSCICHDSANQSPEHFGYNCRSVTKIAEIQMEHNAWYLLPLFFLDTFIQSAKLHGAYLLRLRMLMQHHWDKIRSVMIKMAVMYFGRPSAHPIC